eukprot:5743667-Amphidinium_carterae.1
MSQGTTAQQVPNACRSHNVPGFRQEPTVLSDVADAERVGKAFAPVVNSEQDDGKYALGLRNPFKTLLSHRRMLEIGPLLRRVLESYLDSRPAVEAKLEDAVKRRVPLELGASELLTLGRCWPKR